MNDTFFGAVDIGGTKTAVGIFDSRLKLISTAAFPTAIYSCEKLAGKCRESLYELCGNSQIGTGNIKAIGIASPGPLDLMNGTIIHIPTLGWKNEPLKKYFEEVFNRSVVLENDTNAAALGEYTFGGGQGLSVVAYITISTGIGCGIVINGKIFDGATYAAGELGHMKVIKNGRVCDCGSNGCLEAYSSGKSMAGNRNAWSGLSGYGDFRTVPNFGSLDCYSGRQRHE